MCMHCCTRPNRAQARLAQAKQVAQDIGVEASSRPRAPVGLGRIIIADHRTTEPKQREVHSREKCSSCGLWKSKVGQCQHCLVRPNRAQATRAQTVNSKPLNLYLSKYAWQASSLENSPSSRMLAEETAPARFTQPALARTASSLAALHTTASGRSLYRPASAPSLGMMVATDVELGVSGSISRRVTPL